MSDPSEQFLKQYFWALRLTLSRKSVWIPLLLATIVIQAPQVFYFLSQNGNRKMLSPQRAQGLNWAGDGRVWGTFLPRSNLQPKPTDKYVTVLGNLTDLEDWDQLTQLKDLQGLQFRLTTPHGDVTPQRQFLSQLHRVPGLKRLSLQGFTLSRDDFKSLAELKKLNFLELEQSFVKEGLEELSVLPQLKTLILGDNSLRDSEVLSQVRSLKPLQVLGMGEVWGWSLSRLRTKKPLDLSGLTALPHLRAIYASWEPTGQQFRLSPEELQGIAAQRTHLAELLPRVWLLPINQPATAAHLAIPYWMPFFFLCLFGGMHFQGQFQYLGRMTYPHFLVPHLLAAGTLLIGLSLQFLLPALLAAPWPPLLSLLLWSTIVVFASSNWGRTQIPNPKSNTPVAIALRLTLFALSMVVISTFTSSLTLLGRVEPWYMDAFFQLFTDFITTGILWKSILSLLAVAAAVTLGTFRLITLYRRLLVAGVPVPSVTMQRDWGMLGQTATQSGPSENPFFKPQNPALWEALSHATTPLGHPGISLLRSVYPRNISWWIPLTAILCGSFMLPAMLMTPNPAIGWNILIITVLIQMSFQVLLVTYSFWTRRLSGLGYELLVKPMSRQQIRRTMLRLYFRDIFPFCLGILLLVQIAFFFTRQEIHPLLGSLGMLWSTTGFCLTFFGFLYFVFTLRSAWRAIVIMFAVGILSFTMLTIPLVNPPNTDTLGRFLNSPLYPVFAGSLFWSLGLGILSWAYHRWWTLEFP